MLKMSCLTKCTYLLDLLVMDSTKYTPVENTLTSDIMGKVQPSTTLLLRGAAKQYEIRAKFSLDDIRIFFFVLFEEKKKHSVLELKGVFVLLIQSVSHREVKHNGCDAVSF